MSNPNLRGHPMADLAHHDPREVLEFMLAHGAVRYSENGAITHLPCSLTPWQAPRDFVKETEETTSLTTELYHSVAGDVDFLHRELEAARAADPFIESLFQAMGQEAPGKPSLYLNRNDCMPAIQPEGGVWPKQVEMNLMASALGEASSVVWRMHRFVGQHLGLNLKENWAGKNLAGALAEGHRALNADGIVLLLIPVGEVSVFDQRILETRLVEEHGLKTKRASLEELGERGEVRGGHLYLDGHKVSIVYFRSGYAPFHYSNDSAWKARHLIEASSAVSIPSARTQLANTKLIQLVLSQQSVLERFVAPDVAQRLARSCVAFSKLDQPLRGPDGVERLGRDVALANPDDWVLKPHREGGGNNFFGDQLVSQLKSMTQAEGAAYILMEKIRQPVFESVRLVDGVAIPCRCFTELGFFSTAYYDAGASQPRFLNTDGYLLRTKDESMDEGLVLGGFSFLDTLALDS
jgi:glutathione synthase